MSKNIGFKQLATLKERTEFINEFGIDAAIKKWGASSETLYRQRRKYNEYIGKDDFSISNKIPKVLLFDLETSYMQGLFFSTFKPMIPHGNIQVQSHLHSWAGKWLNESEVFGDVQTPKEALNHNDKRITKSLWTVVDQADIIIAHNLGGFDRKVANTRFLINGMNPPSPYQQIDTLLVARKNFKHASNRLDYLGQILVSDEKIHTNNKLWIDCFNGKKESLDEMYKYNKQDVVLLEEIYYELRPWMNSHPNLSLIAESVEETCPTCLSEDLSECGEYMTPAGRFDSIRCNHCGAISRRRKTNLSKAEKESLLVSTAR